MPNNGDLIKMLAPAIEGPSDPLGGTPHTLSRSIPHQGKEEGLLLSFDRRHYGPERLINFQKVTLLG